MNKIKYECSNCGWSAGVPAQWGDVKPTYCGNAKCDYSKAKAPKTKKSFRTEPDKLKVTKPEAPKVEKSDAKKPAEQPSEKKTVKRRKPRGKSENGQSGSAE